ncbi:MAG: ATP-dependent sacrificial sulfur transferase LarE [Bacteroidales bacterium]|nr:ATP-dependent sacrificial sulfur transferase LarE [Bacteroidales bacterium]
MTLRDKHNRLKRILSDAGSAIIALSGGTDSSFLVSVASTVGNARFMAVTVNTPYMFASEVSEASVFCRSVGMKHREIAFGIPESVTGNPPDRCYLCKTVVIQAIRKIAAEEKIETIFDGTNADDVHDYRPGMRALEEQKVRSPLLEAGLTKEDIRALARDAGLDISEKLSNTCLLTRFPHDTIITPSDLRKVEQAELLLAELGFRAPRIRVHGEIARIELRKEQICSITSDEVREKVVSRLKELGYIYVTIDLEGYRSGSMNKIV